MNRLICLVIISLVVLCLGTPAAAYPNYGTFSYWYSDSSSIGYFEVSANSVGIAKDAGVSITDDNLVSYVLHGLLAWPLANYNYTIIDDLNNARLKVWCITRATANSLGIPASAVGFNMWLDAYITGTGSYGASTKYIYAIPRYLTGYIWDSQTSNFSHAQWHSIAAHEHGHGLGYHGHNWNSTQLMYPSMNNVTTPQLEDKRHMRNMYIIN